jgi:hypothetical protein
VLSWIACDGARAVLLVAGAVKYTRGEEARAGVWRWGKLRERDKPATANKPTIMSVHETVAPGWGEGHAMDVRPVDCRERCVRVMQDCYVM